MAIGTTLFCPNDSYIAQLIYARTLINARGIADCSTNRAGKMKCLEALLLSGLTPVNLVDCVG